MSRIKFVQTDSRWGNLGYPKAPCYLRNCGCGEVSIANILVEMEQYRKYTPRTIQPYCKQFGAPNCDGTYFSGIPKMLSHYGLTEVKEHQTMSSLWKELKKDGRVAVYLMGSRRGGSKGVHWSSGGHFVCSVDYKGQNGKHYVFVKDSYSNRRRRNGWITYEENMRSDVLRVWSAKLNSKKVKAYVPTKPYTGKLPKGTVAKGDKGADVKAVQTFLNWCIGTKLKVDGHCGDMTDKAISKIKLKEDSPCYNQGSPLFNYPTPRSVFSMSTSILGSSFICGYTSEANHAASSSLRLVAVPLLQKTFTLKYSK